MSMLQHPCLECKCLVEKGKCSFSRPLNRTTAISTYNWRSQKTVIQSLNRLTPLSSFNVQTGLLYAPNSRALPSRYIPRSSSFVFHPTEMLYGMGEPDGTGEFASDYRRNYILTHASSENIWLQTHSPIGHPSCIIDI
jgi:hypothetical protein